MSARGFARFQSDWAIGMTCRSNSGPHGQHMSGVPLFNRQLNAMARSSCERAKPQRRCCRSTTSPRVMNLLDPRQAAIVRRYAAMLTDHNGNSNGYAQVQLDLLCTVTRDTRASRSAGSPTNSHPTTGRVHTDRAHETLPLTGGMMPVQRHAWW